MNNCSKCKRICAHCDDGIEAYYELVRSEFVAPEGYTRQDGSPCQFEDFVEAKDILYEYLELKKSEAWDDGIQDKDPKYGNGWFGCDEFDCDEFPSIDIDERVM